ncbi:MAG: ABC transporter ATP-binding protein [Bacteroidales bacterium]|nr:ABC transporter ATP-binding protein [Bacteroidales bacterium]
MKNPESILNIDNLEIGYSLKKEQKNILFKDINLSAKSGELIALIGKNGIGKSTLLRNIAGLQEPLAGRISFYNKLLRKYKRSEFARLVSFVSTEIVRVNNLKVFDLVALGRFPHTNWMGKLQTEDIVRSNDAIGMVGMKSYLNKNVDEISDGERQRVMIARTLAQDTKIIVLDEPTAFLDLPNKFEIVHLLNKLSKEENKTIIFSTHDLNTAIHEADKVWLMLDDKVIEGAPEDLILNDQFNELFKDSTLNFDKTKGDFRMKRAQREKIGLSGEGLHYNWTKKALERLDYKVLKDNQEITNIKIEFGNENCKWILNIENNEFVFKSIYDLSLYLKSQTKF